MGCSPWGNTQLTSASPKPILLGGGGGGGGGGALTLQTK